MGYRDRARPNMRPTEAEEVAKSMGWTPSPGDYVIYINKHGRYAIGRIQCLARDTVSINEPFLPKWFVQDPSQGKHSGPVEKVIEQLIFPILE